MIVLGLGNPGKKYEYTRHNAGFLALDAVAAKNDVSFSDEPIFASAIAKLPAFILAKPDTFMNESGKAAQLLLKQFDGPLTVVYDDISIPLGTIKCSYDRGSGDHNGVQSIIDTLGHREFFRIRIGVKPVHEELLPRIAPPDGFETFLLSNFTPMEAELLGKGISTAGEVIELLPEKTFEQLMNQFNA